MNKGIFESNSNSPQGKSTSPFAVVADESSGAGKSSPFAVFGGSNTPSAAPQGQDGDPSRGTRIPERRKPAGPFQMDGPSEGFGFEAPVPAAAPANSPFSMQGAAPQGSPFSVGEAPRQQSAPSSPFSNLQQPFAAQPQQAPAQQPFPMQAAPMQQVPSAFQPQQAPAPQPQPAPQFQQAPAPAPQPQHEQPAPQFQQAAAEPQSDSSAIRQLELRAIFGVDREMTADEILQRSRALPGMRNVTRVQGKDMATIESLKSLLPSLGFGSGTLKLYCGSVPLEFIREGNVLLALQTDGGFAPGVRETLMLVARELNRLG